MPMMKGHSKEVVSSNIKEMMKAGHPQKQAIAAALASARKYKKMADGGMVEDEMRNLNELQDVAIDHPGDISSPQEYSEDEMLARSLLKKSESDEMHYAMGGLVQPEAPEPLGTKPSENMEGETGEPMSAIPERPAGLSDLQMKALAEKKKKRRFM